MSERVLYCTKCSTGIVVDDEALPDICPECLSPGWRSANTPAMAYRLTVMDRRFLRSLRIAADD
jgi:predicted RNA-binding Zn-ribbon protein involved in translation (DUF1610 family)